MKRGWCPSLYEPMQSGDGLLTRVKPRLATLSAESARLLADAAARFGNGAIELTGRANLQFRGFSVSNARAFAEVVADHGLASRDPAAERRRNVIVAPLAGPATRALATALEEMLEGDETLAGLPAKFGLVVDCGEAPGDIRVRLADGLVYLSLDGADLEASCAPDDAVAAVRRLIGSGRERMRDRDAAVTFAAALLPLPLRERVGVRSETPLQTESHPSPRPSLSRGEGEAFGVGVGLIQAPALAALAAIAEHDGDGTLRLTPWRTILLPGVTHIESAPEGCITDPADPALAISACIGRPGCASASVDTRADAALLARAGLSWRIHVSGCAKGCGRPRDAAATLVGDNGNYTLLHEPAVPLHHLTITDAIQALQ